MAGGGEFYNFAALTNTIRNMKKFLLFIVAVVASGVAHAQGFSKSIEIGGMLGLGTYNNKSADVSFIGGYAFSPRFLLAQAWDLGIQTPFIINPIRIQASNMCLIRTKVGVRNI